LLHEVITDCMATATARDYKVPGTGVGLYLALRIIE